MTKFSALVVAALGCTAFSGAASAWTITQGFDDRTTGGSCGWDAAGGSTASTAVVASGTKSCQLSVTQGDTAYGMWGGIINHPENVKRGQELWFRLRTFMPAGFNYNSIGEGNRLKFLRVHTRTASTENNGYNDIYISPKGVNPVYQFIYEGEQVWDPIGTVTGVLTGVLAGGNTHAIALGQWETYEYYIKFDTVSVDKGGMSRVRFWKNGSLMADMTDRITLRSTDAYSDRTHIFTYWNGGSPATQKMYVDDVVLTTDTPSGRDAKGNPFVGVGQYTQAVLPNPPASVVVQ